MEQLNSSRLRAACICGLILLLSASLAANTIYVKWDSPGPIFDGASWDTAYHKVSEGLSASVSDDEVWVARGTYVECITLTAGVGLYGGFAGTETLRAERDWKANVTILDGNRQGSVVTSPEGADTSTVIDGFTIQKGSGTVSNGVPVGGGILCDRSSPVITNNCVRDNRAQCGAGILCRLSSAAITHNRIVDNVMFPSGEGDQMRGGAGIACSSAAPLISRNLIAYNLVPHNGASDNGGGISCQNGSSPSILSNVVVGNKAYNGGGIACVDSSPVVANNCIKSNGGSFGRGGLYCVRSGSTIVNNTIVSNDSGGLRTRDSNLNVANNIIAFHAYGVQVSGPAPVFTHNCFYANEQNVWGGLDPVGTAGNIAEDPKLASREYGDAHIQPGSPCVNAGDDSMVQPDWRDMDGEARILGDHVDIGADESDGTEHPLGPYAVIRVSPDGNDQQDGLSWETAMRTVQAAIDRAARVGGEAWVGAGTYPECMTVRPYVYMYGGFKGGETERSERDWKSNASILDGQQSGSVVTLQGAGYFTAAVDGLVIQNGYGMDPIYPTVRLGGGIRCEYSSASITNNLIRGNQAGQGGGIYLSVSRSVVCNNVITENQALAAGAGIRVFWPPDGYPVITGNMVTKNQATGDDATPTPIGGGIASFAAPSVIENNVIAENSSYDAGALSLGEGTVRNNTMAWNVSGPSRPTVYVYRSDFYNNVVTCNSSGLLPAPSNRFFNNNVYGNAEHDYFGTDPTGTDGNISEDPLFRDLEGGDYRLRPESPCVDTGTNEGAPPTDILGFPRPIDGNCDGIAVTDMGAYEYQPIRVLVDILPGDPSNIIRLRANRQIPVAVLSTPTFDAREIDPTSVVFGPGRATEVHGRGHWEDVNRDGRIDLLLHFSCAATGLTPGMETATLYGRLTNGEWITGSDRINLR